MIVVNGKSPLFYSVHVSIDSVVNVVVLDVMSGPQVGSEKSFD
jgi:hypothetical protein